MKGTVESTKGYVSDIFDAQVLAFDHDGNRHEAEIVGAEITESDDGTKHLSGVVEFPTIDGTRVWNLNISNKDNETYVHFEEVVSVDPEKREKRTVSNLEIIE